MQTVIYGLFIILIQDWISCAFKTTNLTLLTESLNFILDQEFKDNMAKSNIIRYKLEVV